MDETRLLLTDYHRRGFPGASWRAFSIYRYRVVMGLNDSWSILDSLLHDDTYVNTFTSPFPEYPKPNARGPFILSRLSVDSFVPVSSEMIWELVDHFLEDVDPPAVRSDLELDALLGATLDDATELFHLQGTEEDRTDLANLLSDFNDFIAIGPDRSSVLVLTSHED